MNNSENEMEEDESEWRNSFVDSAALCSATSAATSGTGTNLSVVLFFLDLYMMILFLKSGTATKKTPGPARRVILHFDLDCFYAQVEMIRNPALRDVSLGKLAPA